MSNIVQVKEGLEVFSPKQVLEQMEMIQQLMDDAMKEDAHYGLIPGTNKKTLFKAGAEKLGMMFRLAPKFEEHFTDLGNYHREYRIKCSLYHINTDVFYGEGVGSCSTLESKYRWRQAQRACPKCGKDNTIIKGKQEYGGGWLCFGKKGGCGAKWEDGDPIIESQNTAKVENPDIADQYNTVLKMAKKRAHVDAMITATSASDIFTQDIEEIVKHKKEYTENEEVIEAELVEPNQYVKDAIVVELNNRPDERVSPPEEDDPLELNKIPEEQEKTEKLINVRNRLVKLTRLDLGQNVPAEVFGRRVDAYRKKYSEYKDTYAKTDKDLELFSTARLKVIGNKLSTAIKSAEKANKKEKEKPEEPVSEENLFG